MKFVKLLLCFAVVLAAVVGFVFLSSGGGNHGIDGENSAYYNECDSIIKAEWAGNSEWSMADFEKSRNRLDAYKNELGASAHNTLVAKLNSYAIDCILNTAINEYSKPDCKSQTIRGLKRDFEQLLENTNISSSSENVKMFKRLNKLYTKALNLSRREFSVATNYQKNAEKGYRWTDVNAAIADFYEQREKIVEDNDYSYIIRIKDIDEGLNYNAYEQKMQACRDKFIEQLSNDIERAFRADCSESNILNPIPVELEGDLKALIDDRDNYMEVQKLLLSTYDEFETEFGSDARLNNCKNILSRIIASYNVKISNSENNIYW